MEVDMQKRNMEQQKIEMCAVQTQFIFKKLTTNKIHQLCFKLWMNHERQRKSLPSFLSVKGHWALTVLRTIKDCTYVLISHFR
jgi:hypothetical protein